MLTTDKAWELLYRAAQILQAIPPGEKRKLRVPFHVPEYEKELYNFLGIPDRYISR